MHGEWDAGKESCYRKLNNQKRFFENWNLIFGENNENAISKSKGKKTPAVDERYLDRGFGYTS